MNLLRRAFPVLLLLRVSAILGAREQVLVLHSYHQGYAWTDSINRGLEEALGGGLDVDYYYMDTQRTTPDRARAAAAAGLAQKYGGNPPSYVAAVDDDALRFLLSEGGRLFPGVPLAYCGINDHQSYDTAVLSPLTGVMESPDVAGTLELIFRLLPRTGTLLVLGDDTTAGRINLGIFQGLASTLPPGLDLRMLQAPEEDELRSALGALPDRSAVLYLSWLRTRSGRRLSVADSVAVVAAASPAPVFGCWDFLLGSGFLGGSVVSGRLHGRALGEQLLAMSRGLPVLTADAAGIKSRGPYFDWTVLGRFRISPSALPETTVFLNRPEGLPAPAVRGILALALLTALEGVSLAALWRSRRRLAAAESRYRTLTEQIPAVVYLVHLGEDPRTEYISPGLLGLLGYSPEEWLASRNLWLEAVHEDDRARVHAAVRTSDESKSPYSLDYRAYHRSGRLVWLRNRGAYYQVEKGVYEILGLMSDQTVEKEAEERIRTALAEKETLLKEVHHRVKNNFQIVTSLLRLEADQSRHEESRTALSIAESRIHAMALVHEQLYMQGDFAAIDLRSYLESLASSLTLPGASGRNPTITVSGDRVSASLETAVPLGLFCNEALINAVKHAFPPTLERQPEIRVELSQTGSGTSIVISDNGIGLGAMDPYASASLGFSLMAALADQLGASRSIGSDSGGTMVQLVLPG